MKVWPYYNWMTPSRDATPEEEAAIKEAVEAGEKELVVWKDDDGLTWCADVSGNDSVAYEGGSN